MKSEVPPRPVLGLVAATFRFYRRYPLLLFVLAGAVIVPYEVIVLLVTGEGPFGGGSPRFADQIPLTVIEWTLIGPLISALHVHAFTAALEGHEPRLLAVAKRGIRVLPVVAAASVAATLGTLLGTAALIVPGLILLVRWAVPAQAAAIEDEGWIPALRRSWELTQGEAGHVIGFLICIGVIAAAPVFAAGLAFDSNDAASFIVGVALETATRSFAALGTALLYFDLRARQLVPAPLEEQIRADPDDTVEAHRGTPIRPPRHAFDADAYSDQGRPGGWYLDPDDPNRMRFWDVGGEEPRWSGRSRVPAKVKRQIVEEESAQTEPAP